MNQARQVYWVPSKNFANTQIKTDNHHILLLINGDDLFFDNDLLSKGEVGGKEAAALLFYALRDHVMTTLPGLTSSYKIVSNKRAGGENGF